jgi:hypothetical protein
MKGLCFVAWILLVCYMEPRGAWTWLGCWNSGCCWLLQLYLDAAMLQFKMLQVLLFGVDLNNIFNFCSFITSSFANVGLGFVFCIHFQNSNIYILRFLHLKIHWDLVSPKERGFDPPMIILTTQQTLNQTTSLRSLLLSWPLICSPSNPAQFSAWMHSQCLTYTLLTSYSQSPLWPWTQTWHFIH